MRDKQNITWLIAARALAGIGGGGIVNSVWVITSEIVEVRHRAKWSQALSVTWSCSAIAGPLLGGLFSSEILPSGLLFKFSDPDVSTLGDHGSSAPSWRWGCE
jgi:MFS family permease